MKYDKLKVCQYKEVTHSVNGTKVERLNIAKEHMAFFLRHNIPCFFKYFNLTQTCECVYKYSKCNFVYSKLKKLPGNVISNVSSLSK